MTLPSALLVTGLVCLGIAAGLWIGWLLWNPDAILDRMRRTENATPTHQPK